MAIVHADRLVEAQRETAARNEFFRAELAATLDNLAAVARVLRRAAGYMPSADQVALRSAEARLAQHGRGDVPAAGRSAR